MEHSFNCNNIDRKRLSYSSCYQQFFTVYRQVYLKYCNNSAITKAAGSNGQLSLSVYNCHCISVEITFTTHIHAHALAHRHTHTNRRTQIKTQTQTHTDTHRHTDTHTHRHTHIHTQNSKQIILINGIQQSMHEQCCCCIKSIIIIGTGFVDYGKIMENRKLIIIYIHD